MNSKISFSRPVRLEINGGSVPAGSCPVDLRHTLRDELTRSVVVRARIELDRDLGDPELRIGADASDVRQARKRDFQRNRDGRLELLGSHRRVLGDHIEDGRGEVGKHVPPEVLKPERANDGACHDQQCREQRRVERFANQPANHGVPQCVIVAAFALLGLSLEQEGTIDHDLFAGAEPGEHFDFTAEIPAAPDSANFKCARVLGQEDAPFVADALHRRDRHGENRFA